MRDDSAGRRTGPSSAARRQPAGPRKATEKYLENAALYYLQRYASSSHRLRRVLMRRVERSVQAHGTDRAEGAAIVERLVARLIDRKLVDDAVFAAARARSLRQRGASERLIRARLGTEGIAPEHAEAAVAEANENASDLAAAIVFARRRRLGPFRRTDLAEGRRDHELGTLGRAGFSYQIARAVVDAASVEELEGRLLNGG